MTKHAAPMYYLAEFVSEALPPDGFEVWYTAHNQAAPMTYPARQRWPQWWTMLNTYMAERDMVLDPVQ